MAAGDSTLPHTLTHAEYVALSAKVDKEFFDANLKVAQAHANPLSELQGPAGSGKPIQEKTDTSKGGGQTINFIVGAGLGAAGRRGSERLVDYEEQLRHNTWSVTIDTLRVAVGWNKIVEATAATGEQWDEVYAKETGKLIGRIQAEDTLIRFRQRSDGSNTLRPGNKASLNALSYDDTLDTATFSKAVTLLKRNSAMPASVGKMAGGMELKKYVSFGPSQAYEGLFQDPIFTNALTHSAITGTMNPYWTGDIPDWRGTAIKAWDVQNHDTLGSIGSSLIPEAILGDAITSATTAFTMYGGGVAQADIAQPTIYKPFELFYGCSKRLGETITTGTDAGTYYFLVIDPADGKWNIYSYVGSTGVLNNGNAITISARLHSSEAGVAYTTLKEDGFGGSGDTLITYDADVNKVAFPTGSFIVQCNIKAVPVCSTLFFGQDAGGVAYGKIRNKRIMDKQDYEALNGVGIHTMYGVDLRKDTTGSYHRSFVRVECAYEHPYGALLPTN